MLDGMLLQTEADIGDNIQSRMHLRGRSANARTAAAPFPGGRCPAIWRTDLRPFRRHAPKRRLSVHHPYGLNMSQILNAQRVTPPASGPSAVKQAGPPYS